MKSTRNSEWNVFRGMHFGYQQAIDATFMNVRFTDDTAETMHCRCRLCSGILLESHWGRDAVMFGLFGAHRNMPVSSTTMKI